MTKLNAKQQLMPRAAPAAPAKARVQEPPSRSSVAAPTSDADRAQRMARAKEALLAQQSRQSGQPTAQPAAPASATASDAATRPLSGASARVHPTGPAAKVAAVRPAGAASTRLPGGVSERRSDLQHSQHSHSPPTQPSVPNRTTDTRAARPPGTFLRPHAPRLSSLVSPSPLSPTPASLPPFNPIQDSVVLPRGRARDPRRELSPPISPPPSSPPSASPYEAATNCTTPSEAAFQPSPPLASAASPTRGRPAVAAARSQAFDVEAALEGLAGAVADAPTYGINARELILRAVGLVSRHGRTQGLNVVHPAEEPLQGAATAPSSAYSSSSSAAAAAAPSKQDQSAAAVAALAARAAVVAASATAAAMVTTLAALWAPERLVEAMPLVLRPFVLYVPRSNIPRLLRQGCANNLAGQYLAIILQQAGVTAHNALQVGLGLPLCASKQRKE